MKRLPRACLEHVERLNYYFKNKIYLLSILRIQICILINSITCKCSKIRFININVLHNQFQTYCSLAIYKCASDPVTRDMIRDNGGLELLVEAAQDPTNRQNKPLMASVTGALWKSASSDVSVKKLDSLNTVATLVKLLDDENDGVLTNVAGALAECAKHPPNREKIRAAGGISQLS